MKRPALILSCVLAAAAVCAARAADPVADIEAQYEAALAALKKPDVTGVLITEVEGDSAAAAAGIRAGDILTDYYGMHITTLRALRQQVAEAVARRLEDPNAAEKVLARVRRAGNELAFQVPREPLGVRAVEVLAGVPGPRNVPPNLRGTLDLKWKQVAATWSQEQQPAPFRVLQRLTLGDAAPAAGGALIEDWAGWQLCALTPEGDTALAGKIDVYRLDLSTPSLDDHDLPTEHSAFTFHLQTGDYKNAPAFLLDSFSARCPAPTALENAQIVATGKRVGDRLQTTVTLTHGEKEDDAPVRPAEHHEYTAPLDAIPQVAAPWVAAALPHEADAALGLHLLSVRDFLPRPGYVLVTRGKQPMPADPNTPPPSANSRGIGVPADGSANPAAPPASTAWRVDLTHVGVIVESYWFTDQCRLLCVESSGAQSLLARRVDSAKTASLPQERKPARPATGPASTAPSGAL